MKILSLNPLWILAVAGLGFVGWVIYDATQPLKPRPPVADANHQPEAEAVVVTRVPDIKLLGMIQAGMPQAEVQRILDMVLSTPGEVAPADLNAGFPTYRMNYRATLTRPLPNWKHVGGPFAPGPQLITLVFDARLPGHPLISATTSPDAENRKLSWATKPAVVVQ